MNTYTEGYVLASQDAIRFGTVHAIDKLEMFQGPFAEGYRAGIEDINKTK